MAKITLTRALAELKALNARLTKKHEGVFVTLALGTGDRRRYAGNAAISVATIEQDILSNHQSIVDLMARYRAIKGALVVANANTQVTIAGEKMTIAEAIERKRMLPIEEAFLDRLKACWTAATKSVQDAENKLQAAIDTASTQAFGSDRTKITSEQLATISEAKLTELKPSLIDPLDLESKIRSLDEGINKFKLEVDFILSEVNAKTEIEIPD